MCHQSAIIYLAYHNQTWDYLLNRVSRYLPILGQHFSKYSLNMKFGLDAKLSKSNRLCGTQLTVILHLKDAVTFYLTVISSS